MPGSHDSDRDLEKAALKSAGGSGSSSSGGSPRHAHKYENGERFRDSGSGSASDEDDTLLDPVTEGGEYQGTRLGKYSRSRSASGGRVPSIMRSLGITTRSGSRRLVRLVLFGGLALFILGSLFYNRNTDTAELRETITKLTNTATSQVQDWTDHSIDYVRDKTGMPQRKKPSQYREVPCVLESSGKNGTRFVPLSFDPQAALDDMRAASPVGTLSASLTPDDIIAQSFECVSNATPAVIPGTMVVVSMYSRPKEGTKAWYDSGLLDRERARWCEDNNVPYHSVDMSNVKTSKSDIMYSKLDHMKNALDKNPTAEWAWWIDNDAIFMPKHINMTEYLFSEEGLATWLRMADKDDRLYEQKKKDPMPTYADTQLIFANDHNGLNAGSFLLRRGEWADWLLDIWRDEIFVEWGHNGFEEQEVLAHLIKTHEAIRRKAVQISGTTINANVYHYRRNETILIHFAGCWVDQVCQWWVEQIMRVRDGKQERPYVPGTHLDENGVPLRGEALRAAERAEEARKAKQKEEDEKRQKQEAEQRKKQEEIDLAHHIEEEAKQKAKHEYEHALALAEIASKALDAVQSKPTPGPKKEGESEGESEGEGEKKEATRKFAENKDGEKKSSEDKEESKSEDKKSDDESKSDEEKKFEEQKKTDEATKD